MFCRMVTIHVFGAGSRLSDSLGQMGIVVFGVLRKGRKRCDLGTLVDWVTVQPTKPCRLGASSDKQADRHYDKAEMQMPTPNGRWHGCETSRPRDATIDWCALLRAAIRSQTQ